MAIGVSGNKIVEYDSHQARLYYYKDSDKRGPNLWARLVDFPITWYEVKDIQLNRVTDFIDVTYINPEGGTFQVCHKVTKIFYSEPRVQEQVLDVVRAMQHIGETHFNGNTLLITFKDDDDRELFWLGFYTAKVLRQQYKTTKDNWKVVKEGDFNEE